MFFWGDSTFILLIAVLILSFIVQHSVKSRYKKNAKIKNNSNLTGAEAARIILDSNGLDYVNIELVKGELTDHYDPRKEVVRLSPHNYNESSISAITIAAHECGHALQHADNYAPLNIRAMVLPVANIGSKGAFPLFLAGLFFSIPILMDVGIVLFAGALLFHLVTLPVEFNASSRAYIQLRDADIATDDEMKGARSVLNAAAMTYVATALMALVQLMHLVLLRSRR